MNFKRFTKRSGFIVVEICAVVAVLVVIAVSVLAWRLLSAPLDMEFAKSYVQDAMRDEERGMRVSVEKVVLFWPGVREPLLLGLQGAVVYGEGDKIIASVDEAALDLNKANLFLGRIRPEGLILKGPSLSVVRNADNSFDIGVADLKTYGPNRQEDEPEAQGDYIEQILSVITEAEDGKDSDDSGAVLSLLQSFQIEDASVLVDDRVLNFSWVLPHANAVLEKRAGQIQAELLVDIPSVRHKNSKLKVNALLYPKDKNVDVDMVLERFDVGVLADKIPELDVLAGQNVVLDARLEARIGADMVPRSATLTVLSDAGFVQSDMLSSEFVPYKSLGLLARYNAETRALEVDRLGVSVEGMGVELSAKLELVENGITGPVRVEINEAEQAAIAKIWPAALDDDNSKEWIVDKLSDGVFKNIYAQGGLKLVRGDENNEWDADIEGLVAGFEFEGMSVDYRAPLKPVTQANGKGVFNLESETLRFDISSARVMNLNVASADVELINIIEAGAGQADINLHLKGPLKSILTYIGDEPIGAQSDIDVEKTKGIADLRVNVSLPTKDNIKVEDVAVKVQGTLGQVVLPNVVKGLTFSEGPLSVKIEKNHLRVDGRGKLEGRPIDLDYSEYLVSKGKPYSSRVKVSLMVDPALRTKFGMDLSAFLDGSAFVDVVYTKLQDGLAEADVKADLTQSRLFVDPFDYEKLPGAKGETTLKAILVNDELKEIRDLSGLAPSIVLKPSVLKFRQVGGETELASGRVSRFTLNETVARLEFEVEKNGRTKIVMDGPFLDLRPFLNNEGEKKDVYGSPPMEISVAVDQMRTADDETVQYGKLYVDIDAQGKFNQMEMDAIAGKGDIYLRYKPDGSGKRVFRLEADDAGATLKAFDLYDNVRGGKLVIYGEPIRGVFDRNLIGVAEVSNFKVVDAPALAQLVSAMSISGAVQSLNGEGLIFEKMEANFDWHYRPQGSLLVLKDGRTSGNSLGLTFDGTFDNAAQMLDVSGTIIPLSGINEIIGSIPLVGDILTGGTGALIAATYTVKGPSADPKTSVNPLAALTPGILRRVLFEQN